MHAESNAELSVAVAGGLRELTRWSASLQWTDIPDSIQRRAAIVLADNLAAIVAARDRVWNKGS